MIIGYARDPFEGRRIAEQVKELELWGCNCVETDQDIITDVSVPAGLASALSRLQTHDKLVVTRMDRLGGSALYVAKLIFDLSRRQIDVICIREGINTANVGGRQFLVILDVLLSCEALIATEVELVEKGSTRSNSAERGRPKQLSEIAKRRVIERVKVNQESIKSVASALRVSRSTVYRALREQKKSTQ